MSDDLPGSFTRESPVHERRGAFVRHRESIKVPPKPRDTFILGDMPDSVVLPASVVEEFFAGDMKEVVQTVYIPIMPVPAFGQSALSVMGRAKQESEDPSNWTWKAPWRVDTMNLATAWPFTITHSMYVKEACTVADVNGKLFVFYADFTTKECQPNAKGIMPGVKSAWGCPLAASRIDVVVTELGKAVLFDPEDHATFGDYIALLKPLHRGSKMWVWAQPVAVLTADALGVLARS